MKESITLVVTPSGAEFNKDKTHRFALWRIWDLKKPIIMFIGLNPSTANEYKNDPTIRRVARFANDWGYGGVFMMNLFTFVTPYPEELKGQTEGDTMKADDWLFKVKEYCKDVCFAWGGFETFGRAEHVASYFPKAVCLGINRDNSPKHPLYVAANTKQVNYK